MNAYSQVRFDDRLRAYATINEGEEGSTIPVLLKGSDTSEMNRELTYQIISLPKHGILLDSDNKYLIQEGDFLNQTDPYPWSGVLVNYKGNENFFTIPYKKEENHGSLKRYESFEFAALALIPSDLKIGRSLSALNNITLININDPTILNVPNNLQTMYRFSAINWVSNCDTSNDEEDDSINGDDRVVKWRDSSKTCTRDNEINGISVKDLDEGVEFVRVDVKSKHGFLTLNQDHLLKAEFVSCSERNLTKLDWFCHGTGIGDREVRYVRFIDNLITLELACSLLNNNIPLAPHVLDDICCETK